MYLVSQMRKLLIVMLNGVKHLGGGEETLRSAQGDIRYFG